MGLQKIALPNPETGEPYLAPVEVWLGCLLLTLPPDWFADVFSQVQQYMSKLPPKSEPSRIVLAR